MIALGDLAAIIRSKNAGVGYLTLDILFGEQEAFEAAKLVVNRGSVAQAYGVSPEKITDFVYFDEGRAIKVTMVRPQISGGQGLGETDVYGSGQYAPLLGIQVPWTTPETNDDLEEERQ